MKIFPFSRVSLLNVILAYYLFTMQIFIFSKHFETHKIFLMGIHGQKYNSVKSIENMYISLEFF